MDGRITQASFAISSTLYPSASAWPTRLNGGYKPGDWAPAKPAAEVPFKPVRFDIPLTKLAETVSDSMTGEAVATDPAGDSPESMESPAVNEMAGKPPVTRRPWLAEQPKPAANAPWPMAQELPPLISRLLAAAGWGLVFVSVAVALMSDHASARLL